jgi:hypothetical protein
VDHRAPPADWADAHFRGARLGHSASTKRVAMIAQAMAERPGLTIPELFLRKYDIDATYAFYARPETTPDAIQSCHRALVKAELRQQGRYLLFEDTT